MTEKTKLTNINFFICSTYLDLKDYRESVIEKLKSASGIINAQEFFGARDQKPIETCLEEVEKSDVFIMFIGWRFGSIEEEKNKSFVELEYEKATELGIPKFIFFMDENTPVSPKYVSKHNDEILLSEFKKRVLKDNTVDHFTTKEDLASKIMGSLLNRLPKHGFEIGQKNSESKKENLVFLLNRFKALPKLYYGSEITFNANLKHFERADRSECEAFSYLYGATVRRKFKVIDHSLSRFFDQFEFLYAENHIADELVNLEHDIDYLIKARTIQGTYNYEEPVREVKKVLRPNPSPVRLSIPGEHLIEVNEEVQTGTINKQRLLMGLEFISVSN